MHRLSLSVFIGVVCLAACGGDTPAAFTVAQYAMESPAGANSGEPFLTASGGQVYLSWLEAAQGGGHDLAFSRYEGERWSESAVIAHSERFFVNWADFPSIGRTSDGTLWAHWLEKGTEGGFDYGVRIVRSEDGGRSWSEPWTLHEDASATEHGFVSTVPSPDGLGFVWLDGRRYAEAADGSPATDEMTLRYREVGIGGEPGTEMLIDGRVCDCCQTASAMTDRGPVVAYRNRTEDEIRDIYLARMIDGEWVEGKPIHEDGWEIAGCPVNGPAIAAVGSDVVVVWFTGAGEVPHVKAAFSSDAGASFGGAVVVDDGNPSGRVDVVMKANGSALVSWVERTGGEDAELRLRRLAFDGEMSESVSITGSTAARASGFPRMVEADGGYLLLAWTDATGDTPRVLVTRLEVS